MKINLLLENHPYGPYDRKQVEGYLAQGRVLESDLAWTTGLPDWIEFSYEISGDYDEYDEDWEDALYDELQFNALD